jgi:hypothetical protein
MRTTEALRSQEIDNMERIRRQGEHNMAGESAKKRFKTQTRNEKARRWLKVGARYKGPLTDAYMKRYGVERWLAQEELMSLGCRDKVLIENYERQGIEWEIKVDGYSGDMKVVPKGTPDHELHLF